ncbi:ATP-binding protein [Streptomyces orinoci]|uniref:ATP-binding protein n=1 Tax=Streptomyces orinoci TaxID=67339 RepID=A0ABV3K7C9_STRON|nr:ATP-binding protein [Streptomyces orinoci]
MSATTLDVPSQEHTWPYQLLVPAVPSTVRVAREFVTAVLIATDHAALVDDARVCVSDVVANVVQHAGVPNLSVQVDDHCDHVLIAVCDENPHRHPYLRLAGEDEESGRGLALLQSLADASGLSLVWDGLEVVGKRMWFVLR